MSPTEDAEDHQPDAQRGSPPGGEVVEVELAQSLGLLEALTIGIGTMICAGIFVLPALSYPRPGRRRCCHSSWAAQLPCATP